MYESKKLKECATIIAGQSPESKYYNTDGIGVPFFQGKADFGELYPTIRVYCSQPTKIAEKDDILLSVRAPVGPTNLSPGQVCIGRGLAAIRPYSNINLRYLLYYFRFFETQLSAKGTGTTFKAVTQATIKNLDVPVPPIPDQERIVSRIEELFSQLDASVAELKTAKERLKVYRQAVLKEAFEKQKTWTACHFVDLMDSIKNGYSLKPSDDGPHRILKISAVRPMRLDISECRYNIQPFNEEYLIAENDLLFTRYNGSQDFVGVCACVPNLPIAYGYPDKLIKCTPKLKNPFHSKYLQYYMTQGDARKYIRSKIKTTSGQHGISGTDLKKTVVYLPNINQQKKIVEIIEARLSACDNIERKVDTTLQQAEALRQSILKKAFEGRL